MNVLIADSGSSCTNWAFVSDERREYFSSKGLNPHFRSKDELGNSIMEVVSKYLSSIKIDKVYFYGAGTGSSSNREILISLLTEIFESAEIELKSDLHAAGIACYGDKPGIVSILGTGSNTGVFIDGKITKSIPSLGFILGDEGSGSFIGRKILNAYYYQKMPIDLKESLDNKTDMKLEAVLSNTYSKPQVNRFIASFVKLLSDKKEHPYIKEIVRSSFEEFVEKQLSYFEEANTMDICFVGSIAYNFRDILEEVLEKRKMKLTLVLRTPIKRLASYHSKIHD